MKTILFITVSLLSIISIIGLSSYAVVSHGVHGIDVSHHNTASWNTIASETDTKFAFIKITEGSTFVDRTGKKHIREAEASGIKTGAYHYLSTQSSAQKQFLNFKKNFVEETSLAPMVDVEDINDISMRGLNEKVKAFCLLVEEEYNVKPIIYTRPDLYYSVFVRYDFFFWRKYTFFFWQPIPIHPVFSTGRAKCIWQYSTNRDRIAGTSIIDKDVLSLIDLSHLVR